MSVCRLGYSGQSLAAMHDVLDGINWPSLAGMHDDLNVINEPNTGCDE